MKNKKHFWSTMIFYLWLILIWIVSSIPNIGSDHDMILGIDKVAHFGQYFILSLLLITMRIIHRQPVLLRHYLLLLIPQAFLEELHQLLIPGRDFSFTDYAANALGITTVFLIYLLLKRNRSNLNAL